MAKLLIIVALVITLQLAENQYEVIAESYPINVQKRSTATPSQGLTGLGPVGGMAVDHPLQATVYAYRKGKMKLLVPFEIMIVPMGSGGLEPEHSSNGVPISGQIRSQQQSPNNPVYNRNSYQQYPAAQFGPSYYPPSTYQQPYYYAPYNGYNINNGFYNQLSPYRNPYYTPIRRVDIKPWPQYHPSSQQANTKPFNATNAASTQQNATQNWSANNTAINISSLVNNAAHSPIAMAPTTPPTITTAPPETTSPATTIVSPTKTMMPEQKPKTIESGGEHTDGKVEQLNIDEKPAASSYVQPYFIAPPQNFAFDGSFLPNGMHFNGEYSDQINGN